MDAIKHPDSMYLRAAQGWLELGNPVEALTELSQMSAATREHPAALEIRWQVAVKNRSWEEGLVLAETLCERAPKSPFGWVHRSYCLHELKRTREAWDTLLPLAETFPDDWLICYNLACYACQLKRLGEARTWLSRAVEIGNPMEVNRLAKADADLKPLFEARAV
jgi:predicted Zn-dependent protease